jgi:serpin B
MRIIFNLQIIFLLVFSGYTGAINPNTASSASTIDDNDIKTVIAGNTDFAFVLYDRLKNDPNATAPNGKLFFSPYSISTALAIAYGGARGQTRTQMATSLHFTLPDKQLYPAFGSLQKQLIQPDKSLGCQLLMANALWLQKGYPFLKEFLDLTASFDAGRYQLDFVTETEKSRQKINSWVEEQTKNKIGVMIPHNGITEETRLVITNAVYFIDRWKKPFNALETRDADFYVSAEKKVDARLMYLNDSFKYYADKTLQVVELPYKDEYLSMVIILPEKKQGLKEIERTLTVKMLNELLPKMSRKEVDVYLPKFKATWGTFSLNKNLKTLGMTDAFISGTADFSSINGEKNLFISDVFHKAFVKVNEEGTEAAASTAVGISLGATPTLSIFRADHPFFFIIRDNRSGSILFMGRIVNPAN